MRRMTMKEVNEHHGGKLPADAVFRPDEDEQPAPPGRAGNSKRQPRSERFAALNTFVDFGIAQSELTPAESLVWLVLFRDTKQNGTARTGQADIARRASLDVRTVRRAVASLTQKGMIETVRRGRLNSGPSVYRVRPTADA